MAARLLYRTGTLLALLLVGLFIAGLWLLLKQASPAPTAPPSHTATGQISQIPPPPKPQPRLLPPPESPLAEVPATAVAPELTPAANLPAPIEPPAATAEPVPARIALIIDDIGHQREPGQQLLALPGPVTLAILPFSPYGPELAQLASTTHKEVMLHAPMEPMHHHAWDGGLNHAMNRAQMHAALASMLDSVPGARGVNNHMGSALTQNSEAMTWVMEAISGQGLYFIDSRTSAGSRAQERARAHQIPNSRRDVFLDNERDETAIRLQLDKLIRKAQTQGQAIGIGHPYPETIAVLQQQLPALNALGVELVPASELVSRPPLLGQTDTGDTPKNTMAPAADSPPANQPINTKSI